MSPISSLQAYIPADIRQTVMSRLQQAQGQGGGQSAEGQTIPAMDLQKLGLGAGLGNPIDGAKLPNTTLPSIQGVQSGGGAFGDVLEQAVREVGAKSANAGQAVEGLLTGQDVQLHQAVIAMEESSLSFQLMVEVRNKLLESYQELMRMQV